MRIFVQKYDIGWRIIFPFELLIAHGDTLERHIVTGWEARYPGQRMVNRLPFEAQVPEYHIALALALASIQEEPDNEQWGQTQLKAGPELKERKDLIAAFLVLCAQCGGPVLPRQGEPDWLARLFVDVHNRLHDTFMLSAAPA